MVSQRHKWYRYCIPMCPRIRYISCDRALTPVSQHQFSMKLPFNLAHYPLKLVEPWRRKKQHSVEIKRQRTLTWTQAKSHTILSSADLSWFYCSQQKEGRCADVRAGGMADQVQCSQRSTKASRKHIYSPANETCFRAEKQFFTLCWYAWHDYYYSLLVVHVERGLCLARSDHLYY